MQKLSNILKPKLRFMSFITSYMLFLKSYLRLIPTASQRRQQNPTTTAQIRAMLIIMLMMVERSTQPSPPVPAEYVSSLCAIESDSCVRTAACSRFFYTSFEPLGGSDDVVTRYISTRNQLGVFIVQDK